MVIRYVDYNDDPLSISRVYELSWKYAYRDIVPQEYLNSIPEGKWAAHVKREGMHSIVAVSDGDIIGTLSFCSSRWEKYCGFGEIVSVYLLPEHMGRGVGGKLLEFALSELKSSGFVNVLLWVLEDNYIARRFYEKHGFVCSGDFIDDVIGGRELREIMYIRELHT